MTNIERIRKVAIVSDELAYEVVNDLSQEEMEKLLWKLEYYFNLFYKSPRMNVHVEIDAYNCIYLALNAICPIEGVYKEIMVLP